MQAGYPAFFALRTSARLLQEPLIEKRIRQLRAQREAGQRVKTALERILFGSINDIAKLICHPEMSPEEIDQLDLYSVSELKIGKGGVVEVQLYDRLLAAQQLSELNSQEQPRGAAQFYSALERGAAALQQQDVPHDS